MQTPRQRFGIRRIAMVADRGIPATTRIRGDLEPAGLDWISALKSSDPRLLLQPPEPPPEDPDAETRAPLRPEELVPDQVGEIVSADFPGERLLVCRNPCLRAAEEILEGIAARLRRKDQPLRGRGAISRVVGRDVNRKKMGKHFEVQVTDDDLRWSRRQGRIEAEARLDGIHIVRTSVPEERLGAEEAVLAYRRLTRVERAFRSLKTTQLRVRPLYVDSEKHVRGHALRCMLALYMEWRLQRRLAPLLFEGGERGAAAAQRASPVAPAEVSEAAAAKAASKRTPEGLPVQSLRTLLEHLGTLTLNRVTLTPEDPHEFDLLARKTPLQAKAFELPGVDPGRVVSSELPG